MSTIIAYALIIATIVFNLVFYYTVGKFTANACKYVVTAIRKAFR